MAHGNRGPDDFAAGFSIGDPTMGSGPNGFPDSDWAQPEKPQRDWKKAVLVVGLGALSWVATYVGMLELIESNMGTLPLQHRVIIGCAVAMLMIMIVWLLDQIFSPAPFGRKVVYAGGYLFLTLISVGFGFGFYWKVLESRSEATRSAQSAVGQVQTSMYAGSTRLEQLNATLISLRDISQRKAIEEREKGTSCPNSRPGDGPRRKLRDADAEQFAFASQFVSGRIDGLKGELAAFESQLKQVSSDDPSTISQKDGTRNEFMRDLDRKLDVSVAGFNAFRSDPQLLQIRQDLAARAEKTIFPTDKGGSFTCPDPQLQAALRGVVRAIDQLPQLQQSKIAAVEGSEATIEAFRRLTTTLFGLATFDLPPSPDELRAMQRQAVQSATNEGGVAKASFEAPPAGLAKRDYIPLALAIFVDLCLLLVSMGRPMNRFGGLVDKMREAEKGPVIRILSRFNDIHRDADVRQNFEVFRHVVFDYHGAYYVAVPLDTPYNRIDPRSGRAMHYGASDAQDLQHEAHLLSNLFASFEKEKIFSRVYSPLLGTRMIQKRLARQGSKFAGSSAFRLYRFRDGAWSDVILGAVMGAARRVEEAQRRSHVASQQNSNVDEVERTETANPHYRQHPNSDTVDSERDLPQRGSTEREFNQDETHPRRAHPADQSSVSGRERRAPWQVHAREDSHAHDAGLGRAGGAREDAAAFQSQFGSYAASAKAELHEAAANKAGPHHELDDADALPAHVSDRDEADRDVPVANNNTRPSKRAAETTPHAAPHNAQVIALPMRNPATQRDTAYRATAEQHGAFVDASGAMVAVALANPVDLEGETGEQASFDLTPPPLPHTHPALESVSPEVSALDYGPETPATSDGDGHATRVTLTRETATFTLPTSEADLPSTLLAAATRAQNATAIAAPSDIAIRDNAPARGNDPLTELIESGSERDPEPSHLEEAVFSAADFAEDDAIEDVEIRTIAQRLRPDSTHQN